MQAGSKAFQHPDGSDIARSWSHIFPGHSAATGSHSEDPGPSLSLSLCEQQVLIQRSLRPGRAARAVVIEIQVGR